MYLVTTDEFPPFITEWFEAENNFNPELSMIVYDLSKSTYTTDGINWVGIEEDHL